MRRTLAVLVIATLAALRPAAGGDPLPLPCEAPAALSETEFPLRHLAAAVASGGAVRVHFVGTASTAGAGVGGPEGAFPARTVAALRERFPTLAPSVAAERRRTAEDMVAVIKALAAAERPVLVVWQTGTTDATRNVDLESFGEALEHAITLLKARGADVILVDPQFSPRSEAMVGLERYQEYMEQVAKRNGVPLFRRYDLMRHWVESGRLHFNETDREGQLRVARQVHDCIGRQLARLIENGVDAALSRPR
ncbi:MAG: SGNH/GDSL hydrolase family protein [Alphaproteobacteria bacterium]|nr:SGNH/GDSL hydrolase family protein [Alphaproteobacteria bacterium]